jgi:two-component system chemotaxis response regulator CheB
VLSGARDDGAAGLAAIARAGGLALVQDPAEALHASMPRAALEQTTADHVAPAAKLGDLLGELTRTEVPEAAPDGERLDREVAMSDFADLTTDSLEAAPAGYGCPSCGGALYEIEGSPLPRFRCRVGHAWSPESLLEEQAVALEGALWVALRALKDKAALGDQMASSSAQRGNTRAVDRFRSLADEAQQASALIRGLIERLGDVSVSEQAS